MADEAVDEALQEMHAFHHEVFLFVAVYFFLGERRDVDAGPPVNQRLAEVVEVGVALFREYFAIFVSALSGEGGRVLWRAYLEFIDDMATFVLGVGEQHPGALFVLFFLDDEALQILGLFLCWG